MRNGRLLKLLKIQIDAVLNHDTLSPAVISMALRHSV
jgi:hypothetical protein